MPLNRFRRRGAGRLEGILLAESAGAPMEAVSQGEAVAGGLAGDRYAAGRGYWRATDACEVTLIRVEDLNRIHRRTGLGVLAGEHRRNLVVRGLGRRDLEAWGLRIGEAVFSVQGPRPPCGYLETLTGPGMARALRGRSGICLRVAEPAGLAVGDAVVPLKSPPAE